MNKELIKIGIVSKGRLKEDSEKVFKKNSKFSLRQVKEN